MDQSSLPRLPLENNGRAFPPSAHTEEPRPIGWWRTGSTRFLLVAIGGGLAAVGAFGLVERNTSETANQQTLLSSTALASSDVVALGRLVPQGDLIQIAPPFGSGDARIARLLVRQGETVKAGTVIAELDSLPVKTAALAAAEANLAAHQSALDKARSNVDSSRRETGAELARARAAAELAESQANRQRELFERRLVPKATLEEADSHAVRAALERDRAAAQWERQQGRDRQPDVDLAIKQLDVARKTLQEARAQLSGGFVEAPFDGTLITLHARVGERPGADGIASFGNLAVMEAELEVYQTDIAQVAVGQAVSLSSPALTSPVHGTVNDIGLEVERQSVFSPDPAANTDARVIRVRVSINDADRERAARLSGLDVTARIRTTS